MVCLLLSVYWLVWSVIGLDDIFGVSSVVYVLRFRVISNIESIDIVWWESVWNIIWICEYW